MDVRKYETLFLVLNRISHSFALLINTRNPCDVKWYICDILFNTRNNFMFPSIHVLFCLIYKTIVLLPHKNRAVNSNAFHDNRHM